MPYNQRSDATNIQEEKNEKKKEIIIAKSTPADSHNQKKVCTLPLKSLGSVRFLMFFKEVSSAHQGCIYLIKNTEKKLIL